MIGSGSKLRIDKWLFVARVVKSRSLAAKLVVSGKVRCNGEKLRKASDFVKESDVLTIQVAERVLILRIIGFAEKRGPFSFAKELYEDLTIQLKREKIPEKTHAKRDPGAGRPTKKERREIEKWNFG